MDFGEIGIESSGWRTRVVFHPGEEDQLSTFYTQPTKL